MYKRQSFPNSPKEIHQDELDVKLQEYLDSRIELNSDQVTEVGYCNEVDIYSSEYMSIGMTNGFSKNLSNRPTCLFTKEKSGHPKPYGSPMGLQDLLGEKDEDGAMSLEKSTSDRRLVPIKGSRTSVNQHAPMSRKRNYGDNCFRSAQIHWKGKGAEGKLDDRQENKKNSQWSRNRRASKVRKPTTGRVPKRKLPKA
ncbi:hypothetical protein CRE_17615 [Caenorhabditis remanei]|uniref:Uncharacterized protein n=1 Tax=Caenorhabditis remanei TaxID=31234 RepID=E3NHB3_CAERE|nr:hypothetical protein CRE_17615 [Caenorhabditis remanei]